MLGSHSPVLPQFDPTPVQVSAIQFVEGLFHAFAGFELAVAFAGDGTMHVAKGHFASPLHEGLHVAPGCAAGHVLNRHAVLGTAGRKSVTAMKINNT